MIFSLFQCFDRKNSYSGPLNKGIQIRCVKRSVPSSEISNFRLLIMTSGTSGFSLLKSKENAERSLMRSKAVYCMCSLNSQISPASKNRASIHHESANSLRPGESLISSSRHGYYDVFLWKNVLNVFGSGRSDVRSGTSMTTCCGVKANMDSENLGNQHCMTKHESSYLKIVY